MRKLRFILRNRRGYDDEKELQEVIRFCKSAHIDAVQSQSCSNDDGVFPARERIAARAEERKQAFTKFEAAGIEAHIAILRTLLPNAWHPPARQTIGHTQCRVDIDGKGFPDKPCMLDAQYLDYITYYYRTMAATGARSLIVDDDFRYDAPTCYCPLHLAEFAKRTGHDVSREQLAGYVRTPKFSAVKQDWMEFKGELLLELAETLRKTVHDVDPDMRMGLMIPAYYSCLYENYPVRRLVKLFAGPHRPLARVDGAGYLDESRIGVCGSLSISLHQRSLLPENTEVHTEIDMCPHAIFNNASLDYYIKFHLAAGFQDIGMWVYGCSGNLKRDFFENILRKNRGVYRTLFNQIPGGFSIKGIHVPRNALCGTYMDLGKTGAFSQTPFPYHMLSRWGLPWSPEAEENPTQLLTLEAFPMSRKEMEQRLNAHNVLIDGSALRVLRDENMTDLLGVSVGEEECAFEDSAREILEAHPLNGAAGGAWVRAARNLQLRMEDDAWTVLSWCRDFEGRKTHPVVACREANGRRLAICAPGFQYSYGKYWLNTVKQEQMRGVLQWLSDDDALDAYVDFAPDVMPLVLADGKGDIKTVSLINASAVRTEPFELYVKDKDARISSVRYVDDNGELQELPHTKLGRTASYLRVTIDGEVSLIPNSIRLFSLE